MKKGSKHTAEAKAKIGAASTASKLGKKRGPMPAEWRAKISTAQKGRPQHPNTRAAVVAALAGRKRTPETRAKISASLMGRKLPAERVSSRVSEWTGDKNPRWRGGITPENNRIRHSPEMIAWREGVFARDDYTCQHCGVRGVKLNADHIKPFALYPLLRFELTNGQTLCVPCHKKTPTWGARTRAAA